MTPTTKKPTADASAEVFSPVLVPLAHLASHPKIKNRNIDKAHVTDLQSSISKDGLDTVLFTYAGEKEDSTMKLGEESVPANFLIAGFHRRDALRALKKSDPKRFAALFPGDMIPVRRFHGTVADAIALQLRENVARKDPEPQDLFPQLLQLRDEFKLKSNVIAKHIGKSEAWVSRMLNAADELGEEGTEAISTGAIGVDDALKIAEDSKRAKKAGTPLSKEEKSEKIGKAKTKKAARVASGKVRAEKRVGPKALLARYKAIPRVGHARRTEILEAVLSYLAQESDELPTELQKDAEAPKPAAAKPAAKK